MRDNELTLEQLRMLAAVIEATSFSAAARQLGRPQSAVTYAIQRLETSLGFDLFDRSGYRPVLTAAGRSILPRLERIHQEMAALAVDAQAVVDGLEPEVSLLVDPLFPPNLLDRALQELHARFPTVALRLLIEPVGGATQLVQEGTADLGVLVAYWTRWEELAEKSGAKVELTPVAAPDHPLAQLQAGRREALSAAALRDQLQLVLTDRSSRTNGLEKGVQAVRTWRIDNIDAKKRLILAGVGWGSLPRHMAQAEIDSGSLVELRVESWDGYDPPPTLTTVVVHRKDRPLGPATRWLFERLTEARS